MTLYTKCIYSPIEESDGFRICIMSRLTENDGQTPVKELVQGKLFDHWIKKLAPSEKLIGSWYRKEIEWEESANQYQNFLSTEKVRPFVKFLAQLALTNDVTVLCVEEDPKYCHRSIFAQECQRLENRLEINIK